MRALGGICLKNDSVTTVYSRICPQKVLNKRDTLFIMLVTQWDFH